MKSVEFADYERFVAFTFAAADLAVEVGPDHVITYAAGAFLGKFGQRPEDFVGRPFCSLVLPADAELVRLGLSTLSASGRLAPCIVRLANESRKRVSLTGLSLSQPGVPSRSHLCFSSLPEIEDVGTVSSSRLLRDAEAVVREGTGRLDLFEIRTEDATPGELGNVAAVIRAIAPDATAAELSSGRFGILRTGADLDEDLGAGVRAKLQAAGVNATILSHQLRLEQEGLTPVQAVRALRHALTKFSRDGAQGLRASSCGDGLAGYIDQAGAMTALLRRMIRQEEFELCYQPIVSLARREVQRYEALIRPARPLAGAETPQDFVMMVEALGMAEQLDLVVLGKACEAAHTSGKAIAINLSNQSVQSEAFRHKMTAALRRGRAAERGLSVEFTETAEIEDMQAVADTAQQLRDLGISVALDDFGSGTAGVAALRAVKPDVVKLDGSFISGIVESSRARAMLQGLIGLARTASTRIVAEKIETEEEAKILAGWNVDEGQGWLFGRPAALPAPVTRTSRSAKRAAKGREVWE